MSAKAHLASWLIVSVSTITIAWAFKLSEVPALAETVDPYASIGRAIDHSPDVTPHVLPIDHHVLSGYLEEAALTWMQLPTQAHARDAWLKSEGETVDETRDRIRRVARHAAELLTDGFLTNVDGQWTWEPEPPALIGTDSYDMAAAGQWSVVKTGLVLMSLAFHEGHFHKYVDDGRCNDEKWRASKVGGRMLVAGPCDNGLATSVFQIHFDRGVHLYWGHGSREWGFGPYDADEVELVVHAQAAIDDPQLAVVTALHMVRQSIRAGVGLCNYSGEQYAPAWRESVGCPKAEARMRLALQYASAHPY